MRDISEFRQIVADIMGIEEAELSSETVLTGDLPAIATRVCAKSGQTIILNQGDTWQDLLDQLL